MRKGRCVFQERPFYFSHFYLLIYLPDKSKRGIINEIIACEEGIAMASEVLMTISRDEVERARLASEEKYALDTQSKLTYARHDGMLKGERIGEQKSQMNIARNALAKGVTPELVCDITGLDMETINNLALKGEVVD
jgi:predicted transposase/invertase (TIGR01784 family)